MEVYISGRQFGKTTMLIKESARTGATIAVATYSMVNYTMGLAKKLGLEIPQPVTYAEVFRTFRENRSTRYLVDELQMMLSQLNVDTATLDMGPVRYLTPWAYPDGCQLRLTMCEKNPIHIQKQEIAKLMSEKIIGENLAENFKKHLLREAKGKNNEKY